MTKGNNSMAGRGDVASKLYNARFKEIQSVFFAERGISVMHGESVKAATFGSLRNASLPLMDGLGLVLKGGIKSANLKKYTDGNGGLAFFKTEVEVDLAIHKSICSFDKHQISFMPGPNFETELYRTDDETLFRGVLPSSGKDPGNFDASCEPTLGAMMLVEAIGDVFVNSETAHVTSKALVQGYSDFLGKWKYFDHSNDDQNLSMSNSVILMADLLWVCLAYQGNEDLNSTERKAPFHASIVTPTMVGSNTLSGESPELAGILTDRYALKGLTEIFNTKSVAPRAIEVAA